MSSFGLVKFVKNMNKLDYYGNLSGYIYILSTKRKGVFKLGGTCNIKQRVVSYSYSHPGCFVLYHFLVLDWPEYEYTVHSSLRGKHLLLSSINGNDSEHFIIRNVTDIDSFCWCLNYAGFTTGNGPKWIDLYTKFTREHFKIILINKSD
jgi:hypothetical protein